MKSRILLKEIPKGKFHSAIFTTYSVNLYYLEQQVLPLLGGKDIHYISILCDAKMLTSQLENYGQLSQKRKRSYAVQGVHSNGAFHPKLILLAGNDAVLVLIGSGNLTTSGHGKNLEVWNSIYVDRIEDSKYGFILQVWDHIKNLHQELGPAAQNKIKNIEESCYLLSSQNVIASEAAFFMENGVGISYLSNQSRDSLFQQLTKVIGGEEIEAITIMTPFYDSEGRFIKELDSQFNPNQINVIIQKDFGVLPLKMPQHPKIRFFDWNEVLIEKLRQSYFHAKNILFKGNTTNFLVSGSANASIAAFGTNHITGTNQESCILYQSSHVDFLEIIGIDIEVQEVNLNDYQPREVNDEKEDNNYTSSVFIISAEKNYSNVSLLLKSTIYNVDSIIILFNELGGAKYEKQVILKKGETNISIDVQSGDSLIYAEVKINSKNASNKQFITDINAFEGTNPSPHNRSLNQIRRIIENGNFTTTKIIDYLNTIHNQKQNRYTITSASNQEERKNDLPEEKDNELLYMTYAEIQERAHEIKDFQKAPHFVEYRGVRLWDSIFTYLKDSREKIQEAKIDEEETEDVNRSTGRDDSKIHKEKKPISEVNFENIQKKVIKFLEDYLAVLRNKVNDKRSDRPTLIDLSMYLIVLEILLHLFSHKERIHDQDQEKHLIGITFSNTMSSWSKYVLEIIGLFSIWSIEKSGFKEFESEDYMAKLKQYQVMAFKTNLCCISLLRIANRYFTDKKMQMWLTISLKNIDYIFNSSKLKYFDSEYFISFIPQVVIEEIGEGEIIDEINKNLSLITYYGVRQNNLTENDLFFHSEVGFTYVGKVIENPNNRFYKLFSPGMDWNVDVHNFWNGKVYSIKDDKWLRSSRSNPQ